MKYYYDSWGKIVNIEDTSDIGIGEINPIRYRSYYYDNETGLYYLNSRYYNPEWGRFISADESIGKNGTYTGYNLYAYANNDPINNVDFNGMFAKKFLTKVGALVTIAKVKIAHSFLKIAKGTVKIVKDVCNTLYGMSNAVNDAFYFDFQTGLEAKTDNEIASYTKTSGITISNQKLEHNRNETYKYEAFGFAYVSNYNNADHGYENPYDIIKFDKDTVHNIAVEYSDKINSVPVRLVVSKNVDNDDMFIGVDFGLSYVAVAQCRVGFNINLDFTYKFNEFVENQIKKMIY